MNKPLARHKLQNFPDYVKKRESGDLRVLPYKDNCLAVKKVQAANDPLDKDANIIEIFNRTFEENTGKNKYSFN